MMAISLPIMRLCRNCGRPIFAFCFIGAVFLIYSGIFQYLEEGNVTFPRNIFTSARYFQNGKVSWNGEIRNQTGFDEDVSKEKDDDYGDDNWNSLGGGGHSSPTGGEKNEGNRELLSEEEMKSSRQTSRKVMKILDFNHRKCCPLNYSFKECEYSACEFTNSSDDADLVMINGARLKLDKLPRRHPGQIWLMYTKEPPTFHRFRFLNREDLRNQINWTRCIYRDSTFRGHYGQLASRTPPDRDYDKIYARKRHQAAWFVSNCDSQSRRNQYVTRMRSEIDVHIFGKCGNRSCGVHGLRLGLYGSRDPCLDQVSADYKFYLAFENSLCSDYVTEKFYKLFENVDVIPVVRGGANYSELAPDGSYVNAKDFKSPEQLGRYLNQLSKNKKEYIRMLQIKDRYVNTLPKPPYPCELCKALHTRREVPSVYENILTWMTDHCWEADDL